MSMPKSKWRAERGARALRRLAEIEASIARLGNEDLLDLVDIFVREPASPLKDIAATEMARRDIALEPRPVD